MRTARDCGKVDFCLKDEIGDGTRFQCVLMLLAAKQPTLGNNQLGMCARVETECLLILDYNVVGSLTDQPQITVPTKSLRNAAVLVSSSTVLLSASRSSITGTASVESYSIRLSSYSNSATLLVAKNIALATAHDYPEAHTDTATRLAHHPSSSIHSRLDLFPISFPHRQNLRSIPASEPRKEARRHHVRNMLHPASSWSSPLVVKDSNIEVG